MSDEEIIVTIAKRKPHPMRALFPERKPEDEYLFDDKGNRGPRIATYHRMLDRVLVYEEELRDGTRTPVYTAEELEETYRKWRERVEKRKKRSKA